LKDMMMMMMMMYNHDNLCSWVSEENEHDGLKMGKRISPKK